MQSVLNISFWKGSNQWAQLDSSIPLFIFLEKKKVKSIPPSFCFSFDCYSYLSYYWKPALRYFVVCHTFILLTGTILQLNIIYFCSPWKVAFLVGIKMIWWTHENPCRCLRNCKRQKQTRPTIFFFIKFLNTKIHWSCNLRSQVGSLEKPSVSVLLCSNPHVCINPASLMYQGNFTYS